MNCLVSFPFVLTDTFTVDIIFIHNLQW